MRRTLLATALAVGLVVAARADTILTVNMVKGFATVSINGQKVGTYGKAKTLDRTGEALAKLDVSRFTKPGRNKMTVSWSGGAPIGDVRISESVPGGKYRKIGNVSLTVLSKAQGTQTVAFNLGGAAASGGANGHNRVQPGSGSRQTLMTANIVRGDVTVFVNGKKVGDYGPGLVPIDVSDYARPGANSLRLTWKGAKPTGSVRISYAASKNAFRKLAEYQLSVFTKPNTNGTVSFRLP
ncbi:hypothetical protein EON79_20920 [bacterium]|nr:MAG: hypothetical protein EON79_20920 [bacterium]